MHIEERRNVLIGWKSIQKGANSMSFSSRPKCRNFAKCWWRPSRNSKIGNLELCFKWQILLLLACTIAIAMITGEKQWDVTINVWTINNLMLRTWTSSQILIPNQLPIFSTTIPFILMYSPPNLHSEFANIKRSFIWQCLRGHQI